MSFATGLLGAQNVIAENCEITVKRSSKVAKDLAICPQLFLDELHRHCQTSLFGQFVIQLQH